MTKRLLFYGIFLIIGIIPTVLFAQDEIPGAQIKYITVDPTTNYPGRVRIEIDTTGTWNTSKFQIRRYFNTDTDTGYLAIKILNYGAATTYFDNNAQANVKPESYDILTIDTISGDASNPSKAHTTIFLALIKNDSCNKRQTVNWSAYKGNPILQYQIAVNGTNIPKYESTSHSENVEFNQNMTYQAIGLGQGYQTYSNIISVETFDIIKPNANNFYVHEIVNNGNQLDITCITDTTANLLAHELFEYQNFSFQSIDSNTFIQREITYTVNHEILNVPYKIKAISTCKVYIDSTPEFYPIVLSYAISNNIARLTWNSSFSSTENYVVTQIVDGETVEIETGNTPEFTLDLNAPEFTDNESFSFRIKANFGDQSSISNTIQISKSPKIKMYNAFSPNGDGLNETIGPIITNASIKNFEFLIYNRFGELIFQSNNYGDNTSRWNGTYKGNYVNEGAYMYYISLETNLDNKIEKSGIIHVVYP